MSPTTAPRPGRQSKPRRCRQRQTIGITEYCAGPGLLVDRLRTPARVLEYATLSHSGTGARTMSTIARVVTGHRLATIGADAAVPARALAIARPARRRAATEGRRRVREQREASQLAREERQ